MKTKIVKDVPIGVLLLVLSLYATTGIMYFAGWPSALHTIAIFVCSIMAYKLTHVGLDLISGIEIADKNDKE
jgi:hypothetical protein